MTVAFASVEFSHLTDLEFADCNEFSQKVIVDILVGLDFYHQFISGKIIKLKLVLLHLNLYLVGLLVDLFMIHKRQRFIVIKFTQCVVQSKKEIQL